MSRRMAWGAAAVLLAGCAVGPDYRRPEVATPAAYRSAAPLPADAAALTETAWWTRLQDPVLDQLMAEALANNQDLAIAAARVDVAQGVVRSTRAQGLPQVGVGLDASRQRASTRTVTGAPLTNPYNAVQAAVSASWELDFFGRVRRLDEAAQADWRASEAARRATVLSVAAAVAQTYVALRAADRQLEIAQATLKSRTDALTLFDERFAGGVISEIELNQAQSEQAAALASVPEIERQVAQQENALSLLLGRNPGPIERGRPLGALVLPDVPAGLPSDLLNRRPDVLAAEETLVAANARIGAARALYYPDISLTGLLGGASRSLDNLFSAPGRVWSFAGSVTAPIFTGGAIAGQVDSAEATQRAALVGYSQSVQSAFRDVDDALAAASTSRRTVDAQGKQVTALRSYAGHARARYEEGFSSYLEVLDAERSLFSAELRQTQNQADSFVQVIALYKALGGGWLDLADASTPKPLSAASAP